MKRKKSFTVAATAACVLTITGLTMSCSKNETPLQSELFDEQGKVVGNKNVADNKLVADPDMYEVGKLFNVNQDLSFRIDSLRDYRCPEGAMCIWAGDVDLFFKFFYKGDVSDTLVHLYRCNQNLLEFGGLKWKIVDVFPHRGPNDTNLTKWVKIEIR